MPYKTILGLVSVSIALVAYAPYLKGIFARKTKPHSFSWLVWSLLSAIVFGIQITSSGGYGAWLTGFNAALALGVFLLSIKYGERAITSVDWLSLAVAAGALTLWLVVKNEIGSVVLASAVEAIGFVPTVRKSLHSPYGETAILYLLYALSAGLSLPALESFAVVNVLYPAALMVLNLLMTILLWWCRRATSLGRSTTLAGDMDIIAN